MKKWENAELNTLKLRRTQNGGDPTETFDHQWFDKNGALHVTFPTKENS